MTFKCLSGLVLNVVRGWAGNVIRIFTIFEGTSEIQRMLIGRAVTGLDVR